VRPQSRLGAGAPNDGLGWRPEAPIRVEDRRGQVLEIRSLGGLDVEMAKLHLGLRPGKGLCALECVSVVVLVDQVDQCTTGGGDQSPECDTRDPTWRHRNPLSQREDRIEHNSNRIGQGRAVNDGTGCGDMSVPAEKSRPIGFVLRITDGSAFDHGEMRSPNLRLVG
jgi:hypothetical protein